MALATILGTTAGVIAAFTVPQRIFPWPNGERFRNPNAAPGLQGAAPGGFGGAEGCAPGLVAVGVTPGMLFGSSVCITPAERDAFVAETRRVRAMQLATVAALIAAGYAFGKVLEGDR